MPCSCSASVGGGGAVVVVVAPPFAVVVDAAGGSAAGGPDVPRAVTTSAREPSRHRRTGVGRIAPDRPDIWALETPCRRRLRRTGVSICRRGATTHAGWVPSYVKRAGQPPQVGSGSPVA